MEERRGKVIVVVGGQYGSEAKGLYVEKVAKSQQADVHVRTGAINAGHTIFYGGKPYAMQSVPCGWIDPDADLVIGAGAYIEPKHLDAELEMIAAATGTRDFSRLSIDLKAGYHDEEHIKKEQELKMHETFGSTAHGCMAASVEKMMRRPEYRQFFQTGIGQELQKKWGFQFIDTAEFLNYCYDQGEVILLEGTQGTSLDLLHGDYPFTTSRSTIAANWLMEAGLSPALDVDVVMVVRTFPIRVAGNSGPLPDELEWPALAARVNIGRADVGLEPIVSPEALNAFAEGCIAVAAEWNLPSGFPSLWTPEERATHSEALVNLHREVLTRLGPEVTAELRKFFEITTVTKKLRRIAEPDFNVLRKNVALNRPKFLILNFLNYRFPEVETCNTLDELRATRSWPELITYLDHWEQELGVPVKFVGTNRNSLIKVKA